MLDLGMLHLQPGHESTLVRKHRITISVTLRIRVRVRRESWRLRNKFRWQSIVHNTPRKHSRILHLHSRPFEFIPELRVSMPYF